MFGPGHATSNFRDQILRKAIQAEQQNVAVAQSYAIVMMIRMTYFPENASIPISFERGTAFPRLPADETF
jgi:hypothetical protein